MNEMSRRVALPPAAETPPPPRSRPRHSGPFGVLDIGTTKIVCVIARMESDFTLRVLGFGWQKGRGVRGGGILDIEDAERAIRAAVGQAEEEAGTRLSKVTVNLSAGQPESRLFNVQWPVGGRAVNEQDIRRVLSEGRARASSEGRSIIHALPLAFVADDAQGVTDPRGLHCETLAARLHVVDAVTTALRTLDACLARCDLEIAELVSAPMAAGMSVLVEDERLLGATVLDMGGGTTGMAVFAEGQLLHTAQLPIGGAHVTNDIARILSTPVAHAERLKTLYGSAHGSPDDEREMLPVPMVGEEEHQIAKVPRSMVVNIIKPRLEETFEMVKERLDRFRRRPRRRPPCGADRRCFATLRHARNGAPDSGPTGTRRPAGTVARPCRQRHRPGLRHRRRLARLGRGERAAHCTTSTSTPTGRAGCFAGS